MTNGEYRYFSNEQREAARKALSDIDQSVIHERIDVLEGDMRFLFVLALIDFVLIVGCLIIAWWRLT